MFKTISENPPNNKGKYADEKSLNGKATHYTDGTRTDNEMIGAKSTLHTAYPNPNVHGTVERTKRCEPPKVTVYLGSTTTDFTSSTMGTYKEIPKE